MQLAPELQPERDAYIKVNRLGMSARPLTHQAQFTVGSNVTCRLVMKRRIGALAVMRKVTLAEIAVVFERTGHIPAPFCFGFGAFLRGDTLHVPAVFLPAAEGFFLFLFGSHTRQSPFCANCSLR